MNPTTAPHRTAARDPEPGHVAETRSKQHTVRKFDAELEELGALVSRMGRLVSDQIRDAVAALVDERPDLARTVLQREDWVDTMEVEADDRIVTLLATRQPVGPDLRTVLSLGKSITDLERMGDEAEGIARMTLEIQSRNNGSKPNGVLLRDVGPMAEVALKLVEGALEALSVLNLEQAVRVRESDDKLDGDFSAALRRLATYIMEDSRNIGHAINVTFVLRALERIGDHATNIAEHVIFLIDGRDVRHISSAGELEKLLKSPQG